MTLNSSTSLSGHIAPAFYEVHKAIRTHQFTEFWLKGGRGSTKSSFVAIQIILGIMKYPNANAIVFRKVADTIRTSVMNTLLWAIWQLGVNDFFKYTVSPAEIIYKPTGQKILMKGLDDAQKMKSIKSVKGYFKYLWFEEAFEFDGMNEIRSVEQSVLRGGEEFIEFMTYNPPNDPAAWVNEAAEKKVEDRLVHHSTYLDVPPHWLGSIFLSKAEKLRIDDPLAYDHEYLGETVGRSEQIVFHGKWKELEFDTPPVEEMYQSRFFFGGDWGFANDPSALVRMFIMVNRKDKFLYIDHEAGGVGIELDDLPAMYKKIPESERWPIYADCSRPETISHMKKKKYNISGAPKWEGSVEDGIEYLKSFKCIYIHPRCKKTIEEFKKYSYKVDKNTQQILPVVVGKWDHYIDSVRYGLADYIKNDVSILQVL